MLCTQIAGFPGCGKTHLIGLATEAQVARHGSAGVRWGAVCGLVSLLCGGRTLTSLWDLASTWPGCRRAKTPSIVGEMRATKICHIDEVGDVAGAEAKVGRMMAWNVGRVHSNVGDSLSECEWGHLW